MKRFLILGAVLAAALQTAALVKMITDRAAMLRTGAEVILETGFIDPRDIFRGHYVILRLEISQLAKASLPDADVPENAVPMDIWAELVPGDNGFWKVQNLHSALPNTDNPILMGRLNYSYGDTYNITFPVDRYFAPRKRAEELEQYRRDDKLGVILALSKTGDAAVKGITVEGEPIYLEPLY